MSDSEFRKKTEEVLRTRRKAIDDEIQNSRNKNEENPAAYARFYEIVSIMNELGIKKE